MAAQGAMCGSFFKPASQTVLKDSLFCLALPIFFSLHTRLLLAVRFEAIYFSVRLRSHDWVSRKFLCPAWQTDCPGVSLNFVISPHIVILPDIPRFQISCSSCSLLYFTSREVLAPIWQVQILMDHFYASHFCARCNILKLFLALSLRYFWVYYVYINLFRKRRPTYFRAWKICDKPYDCEKDLLDLFQDHYIII